MGLLATFVAFISPDLFTKISATTPDLGTFFTMSGSSGILHDSCNINSIATLVPPSLPIAGLKYALQWTPGNIADLPEGSIVDGFQLGPSPTFDTPINLKAGPGSWKVSQLGDSRIFAVGWSDEDIAIPITLVKTGADSIDC